MIKTFKYAYDTCHLGLEKGDIFKLIETKIKYVVLEKYISGRIEKTLEDGKIQKDAYSEYLYEYLIHIPKNDGTQYKSCLFLCEDEWHHLVRYSEFVDSK